MKGLLDQYFAPFQEKHKARNIGACLIASDRIVDQYSSGDLGETGDILSVRFPIASLTKSFAAVAVLKLRDEGWLQLSEPVLKYLPELPDQEHWKNATLFHLLSMGSGLASDNPWGDRQLGLADYEFNFLLKEPCIFAAPVGEQFLYSNLGYMMLGRIISNVSGEHALSYISSKILVPLSMVDTDWHGVNSDLGTFGGLTSTLNDMTRWVRFFLDSEGEEDDSSGQVLTRRSRREMQRSVHLMHPNFFCPSGGSVAAYGLGLVRYASKQSWAVGHSGGLPGSGCHMRWSLENRCAVISWGLETYCPVWTPSLECLDAAVLATPPAYPKPFDLVVTRAQALRSLIGEWNDDAANQLFSSNFFLDNVREAVKEKLSTLRTELGGDVQGLELHGERGMSGFFSYQGTPVLVFSLSPLEGGLIQDLRYSELKIFAN